MQLMFILVVLLYFLFLPQVNSWDMLVGGKQAKFERFNGMCRGNKNTKIFFDYYGIRTVGSKLYMNSTITVKEDIPSALTMTLNIQRCRSKENPDTCEEFHTFSSKKYCQMIASDSELWNPFFATIEPKWKCPIKKGVYKSLNSSFDITAILLFPVDGWFWKVRGDMFETETGKRIMCVIVEARVALKKS